MTALVPRQHGENLLHNGGFNVTQRGEGPFTSATDPANDDGVYLYDGCILLSDGNDIADISRVANSGFASGRAMEIDIETANKKLAFLFPVENSALHGVRHSGVASAQCNAMRTVGSSIARIRLSIVGWSGTADAITRDIVASWNAAGEDITPVANWRILGTAALTLRHSIQSIKVKNVAVASTYTNLAVLIVIDDTSLTVGDKALIGDVILEEGGGTSFVPFEPNSARIRCQRLFQYVMKGEGGLTAAPFITQRAGGEMLLTPFALRPTMRGTPSLEISSGLAFVNTDPVGNEIAWWSNLAGAYTTITGALTASFTTHNQYGGLLRLEAGTSFTGTTGSLGNIYLGASAWVAASAEL